MFSAGAHCFFFFHGGERFFSRCIHSIMRNLVPHVARIALAERTNACRSMHSEHLACVLDDHTQIKLRKFTSTRFVAPGQCVTCLSLSNIEVDSQQRRRGHARRALATLRKAAHDNDHVLLVENVVSDHMHQLINSLDGAALPGCRPGACGGAAS